MKIAFMGTPALAVPCLDALAQDHEIAVVVTQPDKMGGRRNHELLSPPVKARALELGVPVLQPERARNEEFVAQLRAFEPDAIAVVAYGQILPRSVLELAPRGCVNLHFSLLPRWRGAAPVQYALWNGDTVTGVTTQWMAEKLDAGDVIQQLEVPIEGGESSGELLARLTTIGADVLRETFAMLADGTAPRTPQDEAGVTLCPQITKEMAQINWEMDADKIVNTVRAMNPWPTAWCQFRGEPLKIWRAQVVAPEALAATNGAGEILLASNDGLIIATGEHKAVQLLEVQAPGKPKMNAVDWARGARLKVGEIFA
jgi:methionyl-tRNA formyltransferase